MTTIYSMEFEQGTTEKTTEKILNIISENPNITTEELAKRCGLTPDEMSFNYENHPRTIRYPHRPGPGLAAAEDEFGPEERAGGW